MKIEIKRAIETDLSVLSNIYVDGQWECYGLEPARVNPVNVGHPLIPAGTYPVIFTPSPHLGYVTPELVDVPGRSDIRVHVGNFPKDTLGCTLVGQTKAQDTVFESQAAFTALLTLLKTATDPIVAVYTDPVV
jgi:Family of unknown function (DUF5675)